jgi:integrase
MANKKVTLVRLCKTSEGWKRYPIVMGKNGRIRPGYALVNGEPVLYPEGHYEIRSYQGPKTVYKNVGDNAIDALAAQQKESHLLLAKDSAQSAGVQLVVETDRVPLSRQATKFVQAAKDRDANVVAASYRLAIAEFLSDSGRTYANQVTKDDVTGHHIALKRRGCGARTVHNRHVLVKAFLLYCGVDEKMFGKDAGTRPPKYDKTKPEIYENGDLNPFFSSLSDPYHLLIFNLLLKTGLREQEAMYLEWPDISFPASTLTIHSKPDLGFRIKDKEERSVPVPSDLLEMMKTYRAANPSKHFVIGNAKDRPHTKLLRLLKGLVREAGLNCGRCPSCRDRQECEKWFLHKFRATYCTMLLRSGNLLCNRCDLSNFNARFNTFIQHRTDCDKCNEI